MLNPIYQTVSYAVQAATEPVQKIPAALQKPRQSQKTDVLDTYRRADGSEADRFDLSAEPLPEQSAADGNEQKFRELLHQFVGQTLFGQMLKSMRATQEKNPYFHGGHAEEIFQSQLDMVLTDQLTKSTSKTLSEPMYKLMKAPKS